MSDEYLPVGEGVFGGDDESPDQDELTRAWLLGDDTYMTVAERIEYCATIGRYDIAEELAKR